MSELALTLLRFGFLLLLWFFVLMAVICQLLAIQQLPVRQPKP